MANNKDLFLKNTLKYKSWTSLDTSATFRVMETNSKVFMEIMKTNNDTSLDDVDRLEKTLRIVWENLICDSNTGQPVFSKNDIDLLFEVKGLEEPSAPLNIVLELSGLNLSEDDVIKNSKTTR